MDKTFFEKLHSEGLLSDESLAKTRAGTSGQLISVHWELRTVLYLGVLLLASGLGIVVYKNIDTIGHQAILIFIALITFGGFYYCFKNKLPFSIKKVEAPNSFFDYVLLLSCLCFLVFIGYWQYQYNIFGNRFGLATFIPMAVLFFCAYFFDHLGILSLSITNLAAWLGIAVTPLEILKANDFNSSTIIITGLALGIALILVGKLTVMCNLKSHFAFTYTNFGMNLTFIACLAGLIHFDTVFFLWILALIGIAVYFYQEAMKNNSFYFLLMLTLYFYVGLSYVIVHLLFEMMNADMGGVYLLFFYFIGSAIGLIMFLIRMNKKIKAL
ncbi:MAG TPA: DUF2157 domain-containing protein [Puia sp.]|nr:DUF2157 domain-containing protein [Puia sp.]